MSYTNDWKEQNIDQLFEWVGENKFDEINFHACGTFKENFEDDVESYISDNEKELWEEYIKTLPEM
jgi:hypothetical protein